MRSNDQAVQRGAAELAAVRREGRPLYWSVAIFSFFVNLLMLTGPLYMLNVYDRVLGSRSLETLVHQKPYELRLKSAAVIAIRVGGSRICANQRIPKYS